MDCCRYIVSIDPFSRTPSFDLATYRMFHSDSYFILHCIMLPKMLSYHNYSPKVRTSLVEISKKKIYYRSLSR